MKINVSVIKTTTIGISLLIGLTGCATIGKQFSDFKIPKNGKGTVYIYRPSKFLGAIMSYDVTNKDDNKTIGTLVNGSFIEKEMTPGEKTFSTIMSSVTIDVKENEKICIRGKNIPAGYMLSQTWFKLEKVNNNICEIEIKETHESIN